jgi:hypothetical protein
MSVSNGLAVNSNLVNAITATTEVLLTVEANENIAAVAEYERAQNALSEIRRHELDEMDNYSFVRCHFSSDEAAFLYATGWVEDTHYRYDETSGDSATLSHFRIARYKERKELESTLSKIQISKQSILKGITQSLAVTKSLSMLDSVSLVQTLTYSGMILSNTGNPPISEDEMSPFELQQSHTILVGNLQHRVLVPKPYKCVQDINVVPENRVLRVSIQHGYTDMRQGGLFWIYNIKVPIRDVDPRYFLNTVSFQKHYFNFIFTGCYKYAWKVMDCRLSSRVPQELYILQLMYLENEGKISVVYLQYATTLEMNSTGNYFAEDAPCEPHFILTRSKTDWMNGPYFSSVSGKRGFRINSRTGYKFHVPWGGSDLGIQFTQTNGYEAIWSAEVLGRDRVFQMCRKFRKPTLLSTYAIPYELMTRWAFYTISTLSVFEFDKVQMLLGRFDRPPLPKLWWRFVGSDGNILDDKILMCMQMTPDVAIREDINSIFKKAKEGLLLRAAASSPNLNLIVHVPGSRTSKIEDEKRERIHDRDMKMINKHRRLEKEKQHADIF